MRGTESQHNTEITEFAACAPIKPRLSCGHKTKPNKSAPPPTTKTDNYAGIEGAQALGEALKVNSALTTLNLSGLQYHQAKNNRKALLLTEIKQITTSAKKEHAHWLMG